MVHTFPRETENSVIMYLERSLHRAAASCISLRTSAFLHCVANNKKAA